jgi:conjugal transfer ATP-binding protein TraC
MNNPLVLVKEWKKQRDLRPKELAFSFGEQDKIDILSYAGLEERADHLCIDGVYTRTLCISGFPYVASSGWLDKLVDFNHDADITYFVREVDALHALPKLQRKVTELESTRRSMIREGKIVGSEITDPLDSAMELRDKIQRGQEKLFQAAIYIGLRADTLTELDKLTRQLEATLSTGLFYSKVTRYQQIEALQSILPRGEDQLKQERNLDSSSAALTFPFISAEMVQESGILYGVNKSNNSLVILDRFTALHSQPPVRARAIPQKSRYSVNSCKAQRSS